jgi:hypothetical protein
MSLFARALARAGAGGRNTGGQSSFRIRQLEWDHATFGVVPFEQVAGAVMAEDTAPVVAHIGPGSMDWGGVKLPLSQIPLPVLYFDSAPSLSHMNGVIGVTLTVTANVPAADGQIIQCASVVAFLKCNIPAALQLRSALDSALLLAQPVEKPEGKTN